MMRQLARWLAWVCLGAAASASASTPPVAGERLSEWLLRVHGPLADTTALHWQHAPERRAQRELQHHTANAVLHGPRIALGTAERQRLADWLLSLPTTGRTLLGERDPRSLQIAPSDDPVFQEGDAFVLFPRPQTVAVLGIDAQPCQVRYQPGASVIDYIRACQASHAHFASLDAVWVAQPDGRTQEVGVASWNATAPVRPGPGAWVWAPSRQAGIPHAVSGNLARFLATQPPPEHQAPGVAGQAQLAPVLPVTPTAHPAHANPTSNNWGELGYLQTPSARMAAAGTVRSHISAVSPYTRLSVKLQPLDWFEFGFRYTSISNRLYGPAIAGDQSYKDKSIDFKVQLHPESATLPAVALGLRDIGGTGLFASEYLVASKRWGSWDASLGLGWGNLGTRGNVSNPLRLFGDEFNTRPAPQLGMGGTTNADSLFKGPAALFGGVQWSPPGSPWVFKAELDGNSYQQEPLANPQVVRSPVNVGVAYRYSDGVTLSMGLERGNTIMVGLTLQGSLGQVYNVKVFDPPPPVFNPEPPPTLPPRGWADVVQEVERHTGWQVVSLTQSHDTVTVHAEVDGALYLQQRLDRVTALLHALAPNGLTFFHLQLTQRGLPLTQLSVDRLEWALQHRSPVPTASALPTQTVYALNHLPMPGPDVQWQGRDQGLELSWSPTYEQVIGGPDGFLLYQLGVALVGELPLSPSTWVDGAVRLGLIDNYDRFRYTAPSNLPRVRTYAREFATASQVTLPRLQVTHVQSPAPNHYVSVYGGLLEPMYAGVGAEWLYRPHRRAWAFGVDINHVRQRAFEQGFGLRDYRVNTGHANWHWDTGWNDIHVKLQVGRYLAGDVGATLDLRRSFDNGVSIGAWATRTNVSAQQFGEGSFDKGIYVQMPFDALLPLSVPATAQINWNPLTRDGGARLVRTHSLFELTSARSPRALRWRSAEPERFRAAQPNAFVEDDSAPHPLSDWGASSRQLGQQIGRMPARTWLMAGGAVVAASLLDDRADRWALRNRTGRWDRLGSAANAAPYVLAAGAGLLATGMVGESAAHTAHTSLYAGAYTLGVSMLVRGLTGRSRPNDGLGSRDWAGPSSASFKSGFVSNHTALAFALATPFAQQHNMPWLYGVAAVTALGRVQQREHWLSDTVGGALLGYGIGSLLSYQATKGGLPHIRVTPDTVAADWSF